MEDDLGDFCCPVCYEIPSQAIYQCHEGHVICHSCIRSLSCCPQCRVPFGPEKIRNRILESILNKKQFDCLYKDMGCCAQISRKNLETHLQICEYRFVEIHLCRLLGYNCDFIVSSANASDTIDHFKNIHEASLFDKTRKSLILEGWNQTEPNKTSTWSPILLENSKLEKLAEFLCFFKINGADQTFSAVALSLGISRKQSENYQIRFSLNGSNEHVLVCTVETPVVSLCDAEESVRHPMLRIPVNILKSKYVTKGCLKITAAVTNISQPPAEISDVRNIRRIKPIQSDSEIGQLKISDQQDLRKISGSGISPYYACDGCQVKPIRGSLYHCLQCANFDLCQACNRKGIHSHHLFVEIRNELQFAALAKVLFDNIHKSSKPLLTADVIVEGPLICEECRSSNPGSRNQASLFCRECTKLYGVCKSCFKNLKIRKTCKQHSFFPKNVFSV